MSVTIITRLTIFISWKMALPLAIPSQGFVLKVANNVLHDISSMLGEGNISYAHYATTLDVNGRLNQGTLMMEQQKYHNKPPCTFWEPRPRVIQHCKSSPTLQKALFVIQLILIKLKKTWVSNLESSTLISAWYYEKSGALFIISSGN